MGTRADFYVGDGESAEWLGSVAFDGYPSGIPKGILTAPNEQAYRNAVGRLLNSCSHATKPKQGWPWPWDDSLTSDYAYSWRNDGVYYTIGYPVVRWWKYGGGRDEPDEEMENYDEIMHGLDKVSLPDMSARRNVALGRRSGLIIL